MEPLLLFPDPAPPALAQALDLSGYPWKAAATADVAARIEPEDGWAGALICADRDPEAAFTLCRVLRKRDLPFDTACTRRRLPPKLVTRMKGGRDATDWSRQARRA